MSFTDVFIIALYSDQGGLEANLRAQFVNSANANVGALISNASVANTFKERGVNTGIYRAILTVPTGFRGTADISNVSGTFYTSKAYNGLEEQVFSFVGLGTGDVPVNHHTGGLDNLQYLISGVAVDGGDVRAYLLADYNANNLSSAYIKGQTKTGVVFDGTNTKSGRWVQPMLLTSGITYIILFSKPGNAQVITAQITI
jgi:hypothetical protein